MTELAAPSSEEEADRRLSSHSLRLGIPFVLVHIALFGIFFVGWSPVAMAVAIVSYCTRAFGITAFYHRCLAHRAFRTPRSVQFAGAVLGAAAAQRGPLWWVAHHRTHHRFTDRPGDPHSPVLDGFLYSHLLWIFDPANVGTDLRRVSDLARYPELRFLDRYEHLVPGLAGSATCALGWILSSVSPGTSTSPWQMLEWGFVLPTVALYHSTFAVNSLAHRFGSRRFETPDSSRNNWLISLLVLGEGWHNNHHRFPTSARQGLGLLEFDPTWWGIRAMSMLGLASRLRSPSGAERPARQSDQAPVAIHARLPVANAPTDPSPGLRRERAPAT